jgi:hypothetical protein
MALGNLLLGLTGSSSASAKISKPPNTASADETALAATLMNWRGSIALHLT